MFCGKCGSQIDKKTGLCPICESEAIAKVQEKNTSASIKRAKRKGIGAIIVLVLVIVVIVGGIIIAFNKGWIGTPKGDTQQQIKTTYISFLTKVIVPQMGTYDANHPETSTEGVYSALFSDLNNDKKEEFIVAYSEKNGDNIDTKIACYKYNDNDKNRKSDSDEEKPEENVEPIGTVTPSSEKDYSENSDEGFRLPTESILYSIEYEGVNYIIYEHLTWFQGFSYDAHVYTVKDGKFAEISNIIIPLVGSDGTELIYSTKLPESMSFDNSDFDFEKSESAAYIKENYVDDGGIILYFHEGENSAFEYNKHFDSVDSAIKAFFAIYGIEKNEPVNWKDSSINLNRPENVNYIYTYAYTIEHDYENDTQKEKYEFNDYTNWQSLLQEKETGTEKADNDKPDIKGIIGNIGKFTWDWFYDNTHTDKSNTLKRENEWGFDTTYELITEPNINSTEDVKALAAKYYTDNVIKDLMSMKFWIEQDGKLYVSQTDGLGSNIVEKYVIALRKINSQSYKLYVFEYLNNELLVEPYEVNLTKNNGNWIVDNIFPFSEEVDITVIDEQSTDYNKYLAYMSYKETILEKCGGANDSYSLYDIDNNGMLDLILRSNKSDKPVFIFYTYSSELIDLGSVSSLYSGLLIPDNKSGLYKVCQRMDAEDLIYVNIKNGNEFTQETIASGEQLSGKAEEYFKKYDAIEFINIQYDDNSDTIDPDLYKNLLKVLN